MNAAARATMSWTLIAIALLLPLTRDARAQSTTSDGATSLADADPGIRREIDIARGRGIPVEPLLSKVREGRLKRASTPRIRTAVAALAERLDSARAIFGPAATVEELTAGADALAAGAGESELRAVTSAVTSRPLSAPIGALAQLVASGVPPKRAAEMIVELLRRKVGGAIVLAFGNLVESDVAGGVPPEEAAVFRLHSFTTGRANMTTGASSAGMEAAGQILHPGPTNSTPRRRP